MKRVIVIEDDSDLAHLLQLLLRSENREVIWFANGISFLISDCPPAETYIIDINLGDVSGLSICEKLKQSQHTMNSRVIMMSAHPEIEELSRNARADGYLTKPFSRQRLMEKLQA